MLIEVLGSRDGDKDIQEVERLIPDLELFLQENLREARQILFAQILLLVQPPLDERVHQHGLDLLQSGSTATDGADGRLELVDGLVGVLQGGHHTPLRPLPVGGHSEDQSKANADGNKSEANKFGDD